MLRKILGILGVLLALLGVGLVLYPTILDYVNSLQDHREIERYVEEVDGMGSEEAQALLERCRQYNQDLVASYPANPFTRSGINQGVSDSYADFSLVQVGATVGYIEIPSLDLYQIMRFGSDQETLAKGAGLENYATLPVGGAGTHAYIDGHTGLASRSIFTKIDQMQEGDLVFIHVLGEHLAYQVDDIRVVLPEETENSTIEEGEDRITLVTCYPFGVDDHRLLVSATRIDYDFSEEQTSAPGVPAMPAVLVGTIVGLVVGLGALAAIVVRGRRRALRGENAAAGRKPTHMAR